MKSVLFVCVENACRSQLAEAITNTFHGYSLQASSAGSRPAKKVNPKAISSLLRIGIHIEPDEPKDVKIFKDNHFDYVVTMGCGDKCPYIPGAKMFDWQIPDPKLMSDDDFDAIRDLIDFKIQSELIPDA
ncbi:MAG: arsenate reductase ArsC [SAR86 cluster bacterium]|uniref:Arsenate reductase ArsC n=1 Tax=SAR86 cluster bacterium TaxID=2030880 RepID=A0A937IFX8_9GAMM|nr:arsenate reductase ArsC [SAR86 cluster bacterium]